MNSNAHSAGLPTSQSARGPAGHPAAPPGPSADQSIGPGNGQSAERPDGLATLAAAVEALAGLDLDRLPDVALADQVLELRRLLDRLEGHWLAQLAAVDGRGAAGADHGTPAPATASWLRNRLRMAAGAAHSAVRTARALFRGPLAASAAALITGQLSPAHAAVLAAGTSDLPHHTTIDAEPVLLEAARRLDPPRLRRVLAHLQETLDPDTAASQADRQHQRRGLWLTATVDNLLAVDGRLEPEAGQTLLAALEPLTDRPAPPMPAAAANGGPMP